MTVVAVLPQCPRCGAPMPNAPFDPGRCHIDSCPCGGGPWALDVCRPCDRTMYTADSEGLNNG